MPTKRVMVIGGGAAGMAAAVRAGECGAQVTLLERFPKLGKKLLATGNGRCNLMNMSAPRYFGQPVFAEAVLAQMPASRVLGVFRRWGLMTVQEDDGRVYPACGQAAAVLEVLKARLREQRVNIQLDTEIDALTRLSDGQWCAETTDHRAYQAEKCILATGGLAGGHLGCTQGAYALAAENGHRLHPLFPGLAPLLTDKSMVRGLAGLRAPAIVTLMDRGEPVSAAQGEMLFAEYGVSGICVMQLARDACPIVQRGGRAWLRVDFSPMLGLCPRIYGRLPLDRIPDHTQAVRALLESRARILPKDELLLGLVPAALKTRLERARPEELPELLAAYPIGITGVRSFENAQITCGGIDTSAVDPATMASEICDGLYLTGELLDVDGDCGGFNLLFAFATGLLAGENAAGGYAYKVID